MQKPGGFFGHISKTFLLSTCKMEKKILNFTKGRRIY